MRSQVLAALRMILSGTPAKALESTTLDFKRDSGTIKQTEKNIVEAAVCFANSDGGSIVLGVDDSALGAAAFLGTEVQPQFIQRRIYELTEPAILVESEELLFEGSRLLVITVPRSFEIHSDKQGRATRRVGTDCLPLTPQGQAMLREERRGVDWSAALSERAISDVSPNALEAARRRLRQGDGPTHELAGLSEIDLLRSMGVVDHQDRLLRSGEILFCDQPIERPWVIYQHRQTPAGEATYVERLHGPLILVLERLIELTRARRHVSPLNLSDGTQIEIPDFPEGAVREAVANALLHREFRIEAPVTVEHSPSIFSIESPGPLVGGVTEDNILTHPSKPRNRSLFQAARILRIAEETGRGIDRIFRELIRSGHDSPTISQRTDSTRVTFIGGTPRTQLVRYVEQLPETERDDVDTLLVLFTLLTQKLINASGMAPILQKSELETDAILRRLADEERAILECTRESAQWRRSDYRLRTATLSALGSAVRYHRRTVDDIDHKVIAHVREYGRISNRTLQNLLDVDTYRARDLLRDLRIRGILVKTSEQSRGPSVEYGPGPSFPASTDRRRRP